MNKKRILVVDDAVINRELLRDIFEEYYEVLEAVDGEQAIQIIEREHDTINLILLDLVMPKKNGIDVLKYMHRFDLVDKIPVVMITGEATVDSDVTAYEYGAADIIYKPFEPRVVIRRAKNLMELYQHREDIETALEERTAQLRESQERLLKNNEFLVNALGSVVEFRSTESGEHIQRVKGFTRIILKYVMQEHPEIKLDDAEISLISEAAALHDVGKIAIPDAILNKPGRLTEEEFEEMKKHTTYGCGILERFKQEDTKFYKYCYEICRWHHEKADGKGYPDHLTGEEIPIWAHIVAVVDCFDALVSKRVYKDSYAVETAYEMILDGQCGQFTELVKECFALAKDELFEKVKGSYSE